MSLGKRIAHPRAEETQLTLVSESRRCRRCATLKPAEDFPTSRKRGRVRIDCHCRPCRKAYQHEWYLAHREHALAAAAARRERDRAARRPNPPTPERCPLREAIGFRKHPNPRKQGNAGLGIAIAYFSRIGVDVAIPLTDTQRYDLVIDNGQGLERVQVKTTTMKQGRGYSVHLRTVGGNKSQVVSRAFHPSDYDWRFVVCGDATAYLIPTTAITSRSSLFLSRKYEPYRIQD
ncbi:MAG: group I intron-associated PD-(D/E)XK endonuclease [Acidimicrobiia bacterium]